MKRHPFDVFAFCAGVLFGVLAFGFLLDGLDVWHADVALIGPVLLMVFGLAVFLSTFSRLRRERVRKASADGTTDEKPREPEEPEDAEHSDSTVPRLP